MFVRAQPVLDVAHAGTGGPSNDRDRFAFRRARSSTTRSPISRSPSGAARRSSWPRWRCPASIACREEYGPAQAAQGRAHHRLAAHDDPDRGAHRDARRPRRRGALGELQHLLDAGPRRGRGRGRPHRHRRQARGRARVRVEGRDARGVLVVHRAGAALARAPTRTARTARTCCSTTAATRRC